MDVEIAEARAILKLYKIKLLNRNSISEEDEDLQNFKKTDQHFSSHSFQIFVYGVVEVLLAAVVLVDASHGLFPILVRVYNFQPYATIDAWQ
ncbi:hypothetical protein Q3G72_030311 [Acer saccharum]|nr:hypothetical protein Q3G72_030311 [Acer saccharum]